MNICVDMMEAPTRAHCLTISRYRDMFIVTEKFSMQVISRFYRIIIRMYFIQAEHNPPHVHAIYGEDVAEIAIRNGEILDGDLPPKALSMVREWIGLHKEDLLSIWDSQEFRSLAPLE